MLKAVKSYVTVGVDLINLKSNISTVKKKHSKQNKNIKRYHSKQTN